MIRHKTHMHNKTIWTKRGTEREGEWSLRVSMISVHFLYTYMRSYDCDISNRWINNTEKKHWKWWEEKRRKRTTDMWLLITLWVLCCTVAAAAAAVCAFFSISSRFFALCMAESQLKYIKTKGAQLLFSDNFPGQKRSFFLSSFSLFIPHLYCISVWVCKRFNFSFFFFFFFGFFFVVLMRLWNDHFFASCSVSSFSQKAFSFMCTSPCVCVQNTHASLDHKGSCWCVSELVQCLCSLALSFHLISFAFLLCRCLLCISIDGIIRCERCLSCLCYVCMWALILLRENQTESSKTSKTITDDLQLFFLLSCFILKMIFINFGFYNSLPFAFLLVCCVLFFSQCIPAFIV